MSFRDHLTPIAMGCFTGVTSSGIAVAVGGYPGIEIAMIPALCNLMTAYGSLRNYSDYFTYLASGIISAALIVAGASYLGRPILPPDPQPAAKIKTPRATNFPNGGKAMSGTPKLNINGN